jgi:nitrogen regulatory protein PII
MMKVIIAMIQPHRLEAVKHALTENQFNELTVSDVQGFGRQKGRVELYRGAEYLYDYVPK